MDGAIRRVFEGKLRGGGGVCEDFRGDKGQTARWLLERNEFFECAIELRMVVGNLMDNFD